MKQGTARRIGAGRSMTLTALTALTALGGVLWAPRQIEAQTRSEFVPTFSTNTRVKQQMERLQRLSQQKLWDEWIAGYQALVDDPRDLVLQRDEEFLIGVRFTCHQQLAALPANVRQRYRQLYDADAKKLFDKAQASGDLAAMREVYARYRFSTYGPRALQAMANRALDEGRTELARIAYTRLEREGGATPTLLLRHALAAFAGGNDAEAKSVLDRVRKEFGGQAIQIGGQELTAAQAADQIAAGQSSAATPTGARWVRFQGEQGGRAMEPAPKGPLKKLWAYVLPTVLPNAASRPGGGFGATVRNRFTFLTFPTVTKDRVIVQGPRGLTALDWNTGEVAWDQQDFVQTRDEAAVDNGNPRPNYYAMQRAVQAVPSVDGNVVAVRAPLSFGNDTTRWPVDYAIAAYDTRSGRNLWRRVAGGDPRGSYFNVPTMQSNVILTGSAAFKGGITECNAVALDAGTGEPLWSTYLGAGSDPLSTTDGSPPVVRDGVVWIESSLYTLNALDFLTGEIRLIYRYDPGKRSIFRSGFDSTPVVANEPISLIASGNAIVFCPRWGLDAIAIDPVAGKLLWSSPKAPGQSALGALFAIDGKRAYTAGGALQAVNLTDGAREWAWEPEASSSSIGYPVLCGDLIAVIIEQKLYLRHAADGKEAGVIDLASSLGDNPGYTSLLSVGGRLVVTTRDRLFVFAPQ